MDDGYKQFDEVAIKSVVTDYAFWITEFYNGTIERIRSSSANLIGFVGVEFGFLATWNKEDFVNGSSVNLKILLGITLMCLLVTLGLLLLTQINRRSFFPSLSELGAYLSETELHKHHELPLKLLLLKEAKTNENIFESLVRIKAKLLGIYHTAIVFCVLSQVFLSLFMFIRWVS